jgi:hypothetical protein
MTKRIPERRRLLDTVVLAVRPRLAGLGFREQAPSPRFLDGVWLYQWAKDHSWKHDHIQFARGRSGHISFAAWWSIPREGGMLLCDGGNGTYIARREPFYTPDELEHSVAAVESDLDKVLKWLELSGTPVGALSRLRSPDRNGPGATSAAYAFAETYLNTQAELDEPGRRTTS